MVGVLYFDGSQIVHLECLGLQRVAWKLDFLVCSKNCQSVFLGQSNAEINVRICSQQGARMRFSEKNVSIYNCCLKIEPVNMFPTPVSPPRNWVYC